MSVRRLELATATGADLDAVGALLRELNLEFEEDTPSAQVLASRIAELLGDRDTLVVLAEQPPVGIAVVRLRQSIWTAHREASLVELYVVPARRGGTIERQLVEAAMDAARARDADFMELTVGSSDIPRRSLYEELEFDNSDLASPDGVALTYSRLL